jgi:hypothetical protein
LTGRENSTKENGIWRRLISGRGGQVFLVLTLMIGATVGMVVVTFSLLTERICAGLYPAGGAAWPSVLFPTPGSLGIGCPHSLHTAPNRIAAGGQPGGYAPVVGRGEAE